MAETAESVDDTTFIEALQQHSLNFGFENGRVRDVCATSKDPLWVTNLKKGVLSAFQQSVSTLHISENVTETDVVGRCDTQYTAMGTAWGQHGGRVHSRKLKTCTAVPVTKHYTNMPSTCQTLTFNIFLYFRKYNWNFNFICNHCLLFQVNP